MLNLKNIAYPVEAFVLKPQSVTPSFRKSVEWSVAGQYAHDGVAAAGQAVDRGACLHAI